MPITSKNYNRLIASATQDILNREQLENFGWNQLGQSNIDSLNPIDPVTMSEDMHRLWLNNPMAFRFIETFNHFVSGDGLQYKAEEEEVQKVLDNFWKHPLNKWETSFQSRIKGLSLNGEMILKPEVTEFAGKVKVTNINPARIKDILKNKGDDETIAGLTLNNEDNPLKVIQWIEDEKEGGKYEGDIFFFQINKTPFQTRGLSDPYFWRDWLKLYDKNLYANAKRSGLLLSFIWDVTMTGAEKTQLITKEQQIANNPPRPGAVRIHNEKETWKAEAPTLNASDIKELNNLIKSQNIAGSAMPEWFYGMGDGPSLATAKVMSIPFFKSVKARKDYIGYMATEMFKYAIWQAEQKGIINGEIDKTFTIITSEPDPDKASGLAEALSKFSTSVMTLQANGLITNEEAKQIVNLITTQMGVEIDMKGDETQNEKTMQAAHKFLVAYNGIVKKKKDKK